MEGLLRNTGLISILLVVLYSIKKIYDVADMRKAGMQGCYENKDIYKAALKFAQGAPEAEIREILSSSYELDDRQVGQTMQLALASRQDGDGGYAAFLKAVNQVLGEDRYYVK
ncbi:hypothetical protein [Paenibacillus jilunlii]|uniref:Uncharacterized protein n=1 Tax=Paenibacillus jilunlii TaxID=682956 RepID=A0A1G9V3H4_9BACL|nr:hypothetical protein [Paenibacillus jilunlii]KWX80343.1 hypothetical protein AML91_00980 [Paenibacillus jilunlii]SDM66607.1 hypothetical protein SAMN05216191_11616 [Paenibacillus jilunlii]